MARCRRFILFCFVLLGIFVIAVCLILTHSVASRRKGSDPIEELLSEILTTQPSQVQVDPEIEKRQEERKQRLSKFCESYKKNSNTEELAKESYHHVIVSDKYKLMYCYVPKVACTQWKKMFLILNNKTQGIQYNEHEKYHQKWRFNYLFHYSEEAIRTRLRHYYKFLFVREPFERLLSAFEDKFVSNIWNWAETSRHASAMLNRYREEHPNTTNDITFTKFIYYVLSLRDESRNEHWRSYESLCHPCAIDYDFIGHFENLWQEAQYVLKKRGLEKIVAFPPIKTLNTSRKVLEKYSELPEHMILQLGDAFKNDLEMFNYPFPGPLSALNTTIGSGK